MQTYLMFPRIAVRDVSPIVSKKKHQLSEEERSNRLVRSNTTKKKHLSDADILEIRTMKEIHGMSNKDIALKFDVDLNRIYAIVNYHYRDHIVPIGGTPTFMKA